MNRRPGKRNWVIRRSGISGNNFPVTGKGGFRAPFLFRPVLKNTRLVYFCGMSALIGPSSPIGVFDSGIGGLTVVKEIHRLLPKESIVYFGDTGRVPYGNKSRDTIIDYSLQITRFLESKGVKLIVIACNTATAFALTAVREATRLPVIGVIDPGARAAIRKSKSGKIGVIGTVGTINSKAYETAIRQANPAVEVFGQATPLLVPLVEEGWLNHPATKLIIREYLKPLENHHVDTLVLGCTHYPLLKEAIRRETFDSISLVDSGEETALDVQTTLKSNHLLSKTSSRDPYQFYVSDFNFRFGDLGRMFLEEPFDHVERVEVG